MIGTILVNGTLGLGFLFALLFCLGDVESVLGSATGFPIIQIFYNTTGSTSATTALMMPSIIVAVASTFGLLASSSRTFWAFARDKGLPFSAFFAHVSYPPTITHNPLAALIRNLQIDKKSSLPYRSIAFSLVFLALLGLINIGSTTAFNAIVSLSIVGLYTSYLIPVLLHAIRRIRGPPLSYGPFQLGMFGLPLNIFAVIYSTFIVTFLFFPPYQPVTAENMNYACVVFGFVVLFSILWWFVRGKTVYTGPIRPD